MSNVIQHHVIYQLAPLNHGSVSPSWQIPGSPGLVPGPVLPERQWMPRHVFGGRGHRAVWWRQEEALSVALRPVHYLLVLFNDNQMHDLITATHSQGGNHSGGGRGRQASRSTKGILFISARVLVCVFKKKKKEVSQKWPRAEGT